MISETLTAYDLIGQELKALKTLQHPNVIWLHEIIDDPNCDYLYLVTDYYSKGSLNDYLQ